MLEHTFPKLYGSVLSSVSVDSILLDETIQ